MVFAIEFLQVAAPAELMLRVRRFSPSLNQTSSPKRHWRSPAKQWAGWVYHHLSRDKRSNTPEQVLFDVPLRMLLISSRAWFFVCKHIINSLRHNSWYIHWFNSCWTCFYRLWCLMVASLLQTLASELICQLAREVYYLTFYRGIAFAHHSWTRGQLPLTSVRHWSIPPIIRQLFIVHSELV